MNFISLKFVLVCSSFLLCYNHVITAPVQAPKLTVVIIADQLAYHYLPKLKHNFKFGLKKILANGVVYTKAYHPCSIPETTTGHAAISTGCFPKDHGGITNQWIDIDAEKISFEDDNSPRTAILPSPPNPSVGKSDHQLMVDTISDQFLLQTTPQTTTKVFALSFKAYSSIALAGKMGKALWFDHQRNIFVSSQRYFSMLPSWITTFNKNIPVNYNNYTWRLCYKPTTAAYNYPYIKNYEFAGAPESYINKSYTTLVKKEKTPSSFLMKTPAANTMLFDLAKTCINQNLQLQTNDRLLLWISLSQLDLLTHLFGPDSLETIDTIYHLDQELNDFISFLHRKVGASNCLLVLTSDHGVAPIPEIQKKKGFTSAQRIMAQPLIKRMNEKIEKKFGIKNIVKAFEPNSFRLDAHTMERLNHQEQKDILTTLRNFLRNTPGIKDAWTYQELAQKDVHLNQFTNFHKIQLFPGRIGEIICQPAPYCQITTYKTGTSHCTPYDYDTHVPLIFYQPGKLNHKIISQKVFMQQLPVTLAHILHITKPSASPFDILPGF